MPCIVLRHSRLCRISRCYTAGCSQQCPCMWRQHGRVVGAACELCKVGIVASLNPVGWVLAGSHASQECHSRLALLCCCCKHALRLDMLQLLRSSGARA